MSQRVSTGNMQLDTLLDGGILRNSMILLAGNPGAGKTILSSNFIYQGAMIDRPGVCMFRRDQKKAYSGYGKVRNRFRAHDPKEKSGSA